MADLVVQDLSVRLEDGPRVFRARVPAFSLASGERKAIVGVTGSGKTTVMDVLALASPAESARRFEIRQSGGILHRNLERVTEAQRSRLRREFFSYLLQTNPLFPFLTLRENARLGQQMARRPDEAYLDQLLALVGLTLDPDSRPSAMSVGQRQRLAMVRAIASRPAFLLCDEPTASLDTETATQLMRLLADLAANQKTGVLLVTHDVGLAQSHGFELYRMEKIDADTGQLMAPDAGTGLIR